MSSDNEEQKHTEDLCKELINSLYNLNCKDYKLSVKLIYSYGTCFGQYSSMTPDQKFFVQSYAAGSFNEEFLRRHWNFYNVSKGPMAIAISLADVKLASAIVKYNLEIWWHTTYTPALIYERLLEKTHNFIERVHEYYKFELTVRNIHLLLSKCKLQNLVERTITTFGPMFMMTHFQRIILMSEFLGAFPVPSLDSVEADAWKKNYAECVGLYFQTVTDPFITKREFEFFLVSFFDFKVEIFNDLMETFVNLFHLEDFKLRSLKHLCRVAARNSLRDKTETQAFPAIIKNLHYPGNLKSYLIGGN